MNVVVCVKQIPDPNSPGRLDPTTHWLVRDGVEVVLDPGDEWGVEAGLQIAEKSGGSVTVVCMGPEKSVDAIRKALAMGAAKAVLITDEALRGSDALTTARVLAAAIGRIEAEVIITGTESTDGSTGVVPQAIAELLGLPAVTFVKGVEVEEGTLRVRRQTEAGHDVLEVRPACVLSVTAGVNGMEYARYPQLRGIMQAKNKPFERPSLADLGLAEAGGATAGQRIVAVEAAEQRQAGERVEGVDQGVRRILDVLASNKVM